MPRTSKAIAAVNVRCRRQQRIVCGRLGSQEIVLVEAMGKRKLCVEEELVDLARRENELSLARNRAMIRNVTDSDPRAVELIIRTLRAHNFPLSLEMPSGASSRPVPMSRSARAQAARVEKLKQTTHSTASKEMEEEENRGRCDGGCTRHSRIIQETNGCCTRLRPARYTSGTGRPRSGFTGRVATTFQERHGSSTATLPRAG